MTRAKRTAAGVLDTSSWSADALRRNAPLLAKLGQGGEAQASEPERALVQSRIEVLALRVVVPLHTVSAANQREHWAARQRRVRSEREAVASLLAHHLRVPVPAEVRLVRLAPRRLDDDNLGSALKPVRDEVAAWLGVDDGPDAPVVWTYDQRPEGRTYGVEITVRTVEP